MSAKDYQEDPLALLDLLSKDSSIKIKSTKLPWDQDITLVDFYLDLKEEAEDEAYSKNKSKP